MKQGFQRQSSSPDYGKNTSILIRAHGVQPTLISVVAAVPAKLTRLGNRADERGLLLRWGDVPVHKLKGIEMEGLRITAVPGYNGLPNGLLVLGPLGQVERLRRLGGCLEALHWDPEILRQQVPEKFPCDYITVDMVERLVLAVRLGGCPDGEVCNARRA